MLLFIGGILTQSLVIMQRVAAVRDVKGIVWVRARGSAQFLPLADAARVGAGDVIRTSGNGGLALEWIDGTRVRIGPNTLMTVLKSQVNRATSAETAIFKLDIGRIWVRVLKVLSQKSKFEVHTPTATAGVRGTVFSVAVDPHGQTTVSVKEGQVVLAAGGQSREIGRDQMIRAGGPESGVSGLSPAEAGLWRENEAVARPRLDIAGPASGDSVSPGQSLEVTGCSEVGAVVTVSGKRAETGVAGRFSATIAVPPDAKGDFEIAVSAVDARGYETKKALTLRVR